MSPTVSPPLFLWMEEMGLLMFLRARRIFLQAAILLCVLLLLLWVSVFLYGSFYYSYMPTVKYSSPVHYQYSSTCEPPPGILCSFPMSNVSLLRNNRDRVLMHGQPYRISLELQLPESTVNQDMGMFMVTMSCYTRGGKQISFTARSAMLHYKSPLLRTMETLASSPMLLLGLSEQKQTLEVELYSEYREDSVHVVDIGAVHFSTKSTACACTLTHTVIPESTMCGAILRLISLNIPDRDYSTIHIFLKMSRLIKVFMFLFCRYLLYNFPITSAVIGISSNFIFLSVLVFLSYLQWGFGRTRLQDMQDRTRDSRRADTRQESVSQTDDKDQPDTETIGQNDSDSQGAQQTDTREVQNISADMDTESSSQFSMLRHRSTQGSSN
eukprot:XP_012817371.1 PREDICTED: LOW QUALITY PROTEIN: seipin [Xenopus tropicalis]